MAEEKKPKIDLKARLGKTQVGAGVSPATAGTPVPAPRGSVPPPVGIPAPVIPGSGPTSAPPGGIPVPPFVQQQQQQAAAAAAAAAARPSTPVVDANDPFASVQASTATRPAAQEIKLEVGAEALEAAKAKNKFIALAGIAGVAIGVGIGFGFGSGSERKNAEKSAIEGATLLAKDVEAANGKVKELSEKIGEAVKAMKAKKFPENFAKELGGINIPFDGEKLYGRGIGRYDARTLSMLFQYTSDVSALNDRKDALKNLFAGQAKRIQEALESGEKPVMGYTVIITAHAKGPVGSLAPITDPFQLNADWPKEYKMQNLASRQVQAVSRYEKGEPISTKEKVLGIPIEPQSVTAAFPNEISGKVLAELAKTAEVLSGVQVGEDDRPGLIKNGEALLEALKKIGAKKPLRL